MCIPALLAGNRKSPEKKDKAEFEKAMLTKFMEDGDIHNYDDWKKAKKDIKELQKRKSLKLDHNDPGIG